MPQNSPPRGHHSNTEFSDNDQLGQQIPYEESTDSVGLNLSDNDSRRRVGSPMSSLPHSLPVSVPEREASIASTLPIIPKKKKSALTVLRMGLLVGMAVCLSVLLLLTLTRMRKRQLQMDSMASQLQPRSFKMIPGFGGEGQHSFLGMFTTPLAIFTVTVAGYLFYQYEQEVLAAQRHRQTYWNFMKVGIISILVGLSLGYQYRSSTKPSQSSRPFLVSWRLFVYFILGVVAIASAKVVNRATRASANE